LQCTRSCDLTVHELARLRLLNIDLARTEQWIIAHASDWWPLRDFRTSGVQGWVCCVAGEGSVAARLDVRALLDNTHVGLLVPLATASSERLLENMNACRLLCLLSTCCLPGGWDRLLTIDHTRIELTIP
jgi:hypothetical protein